MYNEKFDDVPVDPDTRVLMRRIVDVSSIFEGSTRVVALHELSAWDSSIEVESLIFAREDIGENDPNDLTRLLKEAGMIPSDGETTVHAGEVYIFINFGFHTRD